jgi:hypothetical protein
MVKDYVSLLELQKVDEINNIIEIQANIDVLNSIMDKKIDKE